MHAEEFAAAEPDPADYIGATSEELASSPELLIDLAFALVPRRVANVWGLMCLLGGNSQEKVLTLRAAVATAQTQFAHVCDYGTFDEQMHAARDVFDSLAKLESAVFTLVIARTRRGLPIAPPACLAV